MIFLGRSAISIVSLKSDPLAATYIVKQTAFQDGGDPSRLGESIEREGDLRWLIVTNKPDISIAPHVGHSFGVVVASTGKRRSWRGSSRKGSSVWT
jgi:hypothetical protein